MMKGYRTIAWGLLMVVIPPAVQYLAQINWAEYLSPTLAMVASGVITIALRVYTTTAVGQK